MHIIFCFYYLNFERITLFYFLYIFSYICMLNKAFKTGVEYVMILIKVNLNLCI